MNRMAGLNRSLCVLGCCAAARMAHGEDLVLGDRPDLILSSSQSWGLLGMNTAAHAHRAQGHRAAAASSRSTADTRRHRQRRTARQIRRET